MSLERMKQLNQEATQVDVQLRRSVDDLGSMASMPFTQGHLFTVRLLTTDILALALRLELALNAIEDERHRLLAVCSNCDGLGCFLCTPCKVCNQAECKCCAFCDSAACKCGTPQYARRCKYRDETDCDCYDDSEESR